MAFNEDKLRQAIISLLGQQGCSHVPGTALEPVP